MRAIGCFMSTVSGPEWTFLETESVGRGRTGWLKWVDETNRCVFYRNISLRETVARFGRDNPFSSMFLGIKPVKENLRSSGQLWCPLSTDYTEIYPRKLILCLSVWSIWVFAVSLGLSNHYATSCFCRTCVTSFFLLYPANITIEKKICRMSWELCILIFLFILNLIRTNKTKHITMNMIEIVPRNYYS